MSTFISCCVIISTHSVYSVLSVKTIELSAIKKVLEGVCPRIYYTLKSCSNVEFFHEINEQFLIEISRRTCFGVSDFTLTFYSGKGQKEININAQNNQSANDTEFLLRFNLNEVLSILYKCNNPVKIVFFLEIHVRDVTANKNQKFYHDYSSIEKAYLNGTFRVVKHDRQSYNEFNIDYYDEFFEECFYKSKKHIYGKMLCFGFALVFLIIIILFKIFLKNMDD